MPFEDLSKAELVTILELIEQAGRCVHKKDLQQLILNAAGVLEAEYSVCGFVRAASLPEVTVCVNGNYPKEWAARYMEEKLYLSDPVIKYISNFAMTQNWNEVFKAYDGASERRFLKDAHDFNLRHGVTSGVYIPALGSVATFSFAARADRFNNHHKRIMDILMLHFNKALVRTAGAAVEVMPRPDSDAGEFKGLSS